MQVDTGADSTVISSKIWTELGKPQLDGKIRHLEAYDGHQLTLLGSLTCDVEWNGSRLTQKQLAVVQSDKEFGLLGRDLLPKHGLNNITAEHLPAVKGYKAHVKLIPGTQPMFCKARKIPLPLQDKVTEKLEQMVRQGILEPVQPGGVTNESPVVWQRKKSGELRLCVDLKVHINGKVMDEDYQYRTWRRSSITYMGLHTLAKLTSQMPTINWTWRRSKRYMHNQHISGTVQDVPTTSGIEKLFFNLPELYRINTQRNQRCCDLSRRCVGVWNYQGAVRQENACSQESTTWEKNYY